MTRLLALAILFVVTLAAAQAQTTDAGRQAFLARCVGCHGDDGTGGGHGPDIVNVVEPRGVSKDAVRDLILKGIPDAGMPAFQIPTDQADAIAAYVMVLKGTSAPGGPTAARQSVPGDPLAGEAFFAGKGNCTSCHMVRGLGGVLGPDLSNVGDERTLAQIERALNDPGGEPGGAQLPGGGRRGGGGGPSYPAATLHLHSGQTIEGIIKNQSAFDLQLLGVDGKLYLLTRDQVASVTPEKSVMPKVEATPAEVQNLLAYLSHLSTDPKATLTNPTAKFTMSNAVGAGGGVPFADVVHPKAGSWPTYHGNVSGNRFSPLNQINTGNVEHLAPGWMFTLGAPTPGDAPKVGVPSWSGLEVTPIVVDGVMYVTSVNEAYALDARSGREIWHYSRPRSHGLAGDAAGGINRGVAVLGDRVFMVTDNAHLIALHRLTGQLLWDSTMADSAQNYGSTSAPLVVGDLVISGVSGGDEGIRGFLDAYKASTGEHVWRFWTVPAPGEPGSETWAGGTPLEHACAATWLTGTYDPETDILYWPTGNPCPDYNGAKRQGDNLYSSSMLALDPKTGKLKWYYQFSPHDLYDWDATETPMLVDAEFHGSPRKLLVQANRNGFFYVLDRLTGKVLLAEPFVKKVTWASAIGPDGRPMRLPPNDSCSMGSAANWPSTAFNPGTGLFYVLASESCGAFTPNDQQWEAGQSFYGGGTHRIPGAVSRQYLRALDLQTGKIAWELPQEGSTSSGVLATAGGLVFYGDNSGAFVAVDARDGKPLWNFNTSQPRWRASPMTYSLDGNQYVAIAVGPMILTFRLP
jgi:PQQ-dependent dehydrogenase (methanol/ethanol family)